MCQILISVNGHHALNMKRKHFRMQMYHFGIGMDWAISSQAMLNEQNGLFCNAKEPVLAHETACFER